MCGLVGVAGDITANAKKAFTTMLLCDVVRGQHSTGIAAVKYTKDDKVEITKCLGGPWNLIEKGTNKGFFSNRGEIDFHTLQGLIGHNRFATKGEINIDNAHPFHIGQVVGAHNGTLEDDTLKKLGGTDPDGKPYTYDEFTVDSQVLLARIHDVGPAKAYKEIRGAMAITWFDEADEKFYFLRNYQRPLFCAHSKDRSQFFWASEEWMIMAGLERAEIQMDHRGILTFSPHHLYSVTVARKNGKAQAYIDEVTELEPAPYVSQNYGGYVSRSRSNSYSWGETDKEKKSNITLAEPPKTAANLKELRKQIKEKEESAKSYVKLDVEKSEDFALGFGNNILTKKMFERKIAQVNDGKCPICNQKLSWANKNDVLWVNSRTAIHSGDCESTYNTIEENNNKSNKSSETTEPTHQTSKSVN